jgi:ectoine hydroxylase-related dioxygenase (phytanoyl-CoA dioxygenase family)
VPPEELKAELDEYGFVVLREVLPRADAHRIETRVVEVMRRQPDADKTDQHLRGLFNHVDPTDYPLFASLLTQPVCLELARHLLGEGFQMTEVGSRWRKPGSPAGPMHATIPLDRFPRAGLPLPNVCFVLALSWVLDDLTRDMGATLYHPFSHHAPRLPRAGVEYKYLVPVEAPAGSVVVHHGALWHRFGANTTKDRSRVGVMSGYIPAWLDPHAVGWQLMKRGVRDRLPPAVRDMNRRVAEG